MICSALYFILNRPDLSRIDNKADTMSIMVKKLYKNGSFLYKMNLIAGRNGLENLVKWVHIIEDDNATSFLHGNELVFTAGIMNQNEHWLLHFVQKLYKAETSAFVINVGPHIEEIPDEVIDFCNEVNLPLFTIPWETRMVDMTRDFCHRIMNNEHMQSNTATTIKNILFGVGDMETQILQLERFGYQRDSRLCFVSVMAQDKSSQVDENRDALIKIAEIAAKRISELFIMFSYKDYQILVLVNYTDADIKMFVDGFLNLAAQKARGWTFHMGISSNQMGVKNQKENFEKAMSAMKMAKKRKELYCLYDKLGIFKVLYAVSDKSVLREYYKNVVGKLETYDRENGTTLTNMLLAYLENNGSLQMVSEKQYVHRNTVTNQLKKIEEITGYNPFNLDDKVKLSMAFYIKEIL